MDAKERYHRSLCIICKATFTEKKFYLDHLPGCLNTALESEKEKNLLLSVMVEQASIPKHTCKTHPQNDCHACEYISAADSLEKMLGYRKEGR